MILQKHNQPYSYHATYMLQDDYLTRPLAFLLLTNTAYNEMYTLHRSITLFHN